ncbi:hypothetical protein BpHYR1_037244 [Brachionus plicatilis]|uniref:Uncharacterized protein n=1 Tax=Brachionus plicatilis TaxID=10195 RepID=A0A3M7T523_BRAPC|nr:hypothetical protein BpHYR1_037244 [Brachionus plicatilis]
MALLQCNNINVNIKKQKAYDIEKVSYQNPKPSKMAILEVECDLCKAIGVEMFLENEWGLKLYKGRSHKNIINKH